MRNLFMTITLALSVTAATAAPVGQNAGGNLTGDYVEARTASVFAGACHYNGELTTTGREAEMAWHIRDGAWNGTVLSGLSAVASIVSDANLQDESAGRKAVLYIDAKATPAQFAALAAALQARYSRTFGVIAAVKRVPISFTRSAETYVVEAKGVTLLSVEAMPNHECCKQPNLVWYKPLIEMTDRKVGFTKESGIQDKTLGDPWSKSGQNTAFYGAFSL